ncbi:MAG TPA: Marc family transporter [Halieaceae bacterium]|nr:Marc family transporter [Halieaceae bacterium]|tara:strand:+ start:877 stop:1467 length:591 start_codon:yes stop_codon:yes gene_type:complete
MDTAFSAFITLLLVMDPLGNVPIFLSVLKDVDPKRRQWVIFRELLVALGVLLLFLWGGSSVLDLMGLRQESISIAGAIILFLIAIRMIFPSPYGMIGDAPGGEPFIVPLAIPAVAGPSSLAIAMLMVHTDPSRMLDWTAALVGAWAVSAVLLMASPLLLKALGNRGLIAMERLMGMILVIIAVQMFFDGVATSLHL